MSNRVAVNTCSVDESMRMCKWVGEDLHYPRWHYNHARFKASLLHTWRRNEAYYSDDVDVVPVRSDRSHKERHALCNEQSEFLNMDLLDAT